MHGSTGPQPLQRSARRSFPPGARRAGGYGDSSAEPTDADLLSWHVGGDPDAFGLLFGRHRGRLWAMAVRTLGDPEEAADALQDAMISAFRRAASFRGESAVTTWLHRIVVNAAIDRLRRKSARPTLTGGDEGVLDGLASGGRLSDPSGVTDTAIDVMTELRKLVPRPAGSARSGRHAQLFGLRRRRRTRRVRGNGEEQVRTGPRSTAPQAGAFAASGTQPGSTEPLRWPACAPAALPCGVATAAMPGGLVFRPIPRLERNSTEPASARRGMATSRTSSAVRVMSARSGLAAIGESDSEPQCRASGRTCGRASPRGDEALT